MARMTGRMRWHLVMIAAGGIAAGALLVAPARAQSVSGTPSSPNTGSTPIALPDTAGAAPAVGGPAANGADIRPPDIRGGGPAAPGQSAGAPSGLSEGGTGTGNGITDPMVATIEGHGIYLSDVGRVVKQMPPDLRDLPFQSIYPAVLDRLVDRAALIIQAQRDHLDDDPEVRRQIDHILEQAFLRKEVLPQVTETAIRALYDKDFANKGPVEQVRARHILVSTKAEAMDLIKQLDHGADFAALAHKFSQDPSAAHGGDLGYFSAKQVDPAFAKVVFALKPDEIAQEPLHNAFGWHVIQCTGKRTVNPPTYAAIHKQLREQLIEQLSRQVAARVRQGMIIHEYNLDGSPLHYRTPEEKAAEDSADATAGQSANQ